MCFKDTVVNKSDQNILTTSITYCSIKNEDYMFQKFLDSQVLHQLMLKLCFLKHKDNMNAEE